MDREKNNSMILLPVEKGIPIPPVETFPKWRRPIKYKISIKRLFIGDSVFIPESDQPPQAEMSLLRKKLGRNYVYRKVRSEDGVVLGIRIWRIDDKPDHLVAPEVKRKNKMEETKQIKKIKDAQKNELQADAPKQPELKKEDDRKKSRIRNCLWCGLPFESKNAGDRYHQNCRDNARRAG